MFTAGEKRGLIALIILLTLLIVFVICRRSLFSPSAEIAHPPVINENRITLNDSTDSSVSIDSLALTPLAPRDTIHKAKSIKTRKKRKSNQKPKRAPIVRDPLSEPLND